ncbi:FdtA/QdtA family cupin domain-containing protein [Sulfuricurvum sp.]|uniref:sugar 3,4-ketoisomerase n=1 Tax=Sulfuricurvum sp. TaxID=2025608 RepID=UPI00286DAEF4|nr:FdtA/QdtA family cupin domain-containing protein [Sulfuricurvum sp.]
MANIIPIPIIADERGSLGVIEKLLPFEIKRVFYIYGVESKRGGHAHKKTQQALISLNGKCIIYVNNGKDRQFFDLTDPSKCLLLNPEDWHTMEFEKNTVLLVLSSEYYDSTDYIHEEPK